VPTRHLHRAESISGLQDGICRALHCGAATIDENLPACTDSEALQVLAWADTSEDAPPGFGTPMDADSDGCVEPYKNVDGVCKESGPGTDNPAIEERVRPLVLKSSSCTETLKTWPKLTNEPRQLPTNLRIDSSGTTAPSRKLIPTVLSRSLLEDELPAMLWRSFRQCNQP
jgi:hypothetical protein